MQQRYWTPTMRALGIPQDAPDPIQMPVHLEMMTKAFWNWYYNDILHHPLGVQRTGRWHDVLAVDEIAAQGGLCYQWSRTQELSWLTLWTPDGPHKRTRTAVTDNIRPPFSLLTRCWFDLCQDMDLISKDEWAAAAEQLERFRVWERAEYGECW